MHRMKNQYPTEVHFYLILNKQYCCMPAHQNPAGIFWDIFSYLLITAFILCIKILRHQALHCEPRPESRTAQSWISESNARGKEQIHMNLELKHMAN
jgi:hypothetical protein